MTTIMNTAVTAIVATLRSAPAVASSVTRVRLRPQPKSVLYGVDVHPSRSLPGVSDVPMGYPVSWDTSISVDCYARSTVATSPDEAIDALVESVYTRLMQDPTLGGEVIGLQPQDLSYDFDADGEQTTCVTLVFQILQRAAAGTIS